MTFKDSPEGQTHFYGDDCVPSHGDPSKGCCENCWCDNRLEHWAWPHCANSSCPCHQSKTPTEHLGLGQVPRCICPEFKHTGEHIEECPYEVDNPSGPTFALKYAAREYERGRKDGAKEIVGKIRGKFVGIGNSTFEDIQDNITDALTEYLPRII